MLSLGDIVRLNSKRVGSEVAVVWRDKRITHRELDLRSNALANALIHMGVGKGDRVALLATNCPQFIEVHVACSKAGTILVPLNTMLSPMELSNLLNDAEAEVIITTCDFASMVNAMRDIILGLREFISIGGGERMRDYEALMSAYPSSDPCLAVGQDDIANIAYTSGTTGLPKGVVLSHGNVFSNAVNCAISFNVPLGGRNLIPFPLFFNAVFCCQVVTHFLAEGTVVILDQFEPGAYIDAINKERPTATILNPTMLNDFVTHPRFKECDLSSFRRFLVSAAPISLVRFQEARNALGKIFFQVYGATETTCLITAMRPEDYEMQDPVTRDKRYTSVGRAAPTLEVKIVDEEGRDVAHNGEDVGEIMVKGPSVMQGYWKQPEATAATIHEGWFHTGDLGTMDEEGYLWIVGRKKDMIVSGGMNIYPEEIEDVLYTMPKVKEVAVVGRPHKRWGESVTAIIVPILGEKPTEAEIIDYCRARLASYKKPTKVIFVGELPHNPSGKIKKAELRAQLAKEV